MPTTNGSGSQRSIPPYMPYRTFLTFLDSLKVGVPSHIDKSVLKSMAGGMQQALKAALRYMNLIDHASVPQTALYDLAASEGASRKKLLHDLFETTYGFLRESVELEVTTPAQLESAFVATGASGDTVRKAIGFMLAFARDAEVEVSPHLLKRGAIPRRTSAKHPRAKPEPKPPQPDNPAANTKQAPPPRPRENDWIDQLLAKFPNFDASWPDDLKTKWFEGFERLMQARKL
jgi:hypothetical protein